MAVAADDWHLKLFAGGQTMNRRALVILVVSFAAGSFVPCARGAVRLIGITGNQGLDNDETLYEINLTNASVTPLVKLPSIPDTDSIGFNPETQLLHRLSGSESYSNNPSS